MALKISLFVSIPLGVLAAFSTVQDRKEKKNTWKSLISLFEDFEKYNQTLQVIDVKDKLEELDSATSDIQGREALLQTILSMKQDLTRALKVERILRENSKVVNLNPELFETSFAAVRVEQVNIQGSDYSKLINQTLKIGISVRNEMKNMQNQIK